MFAKNRIAVFLVLGVALALWSAGCCTLGIISCTRTDTLTLAGSARLNACGEDNRSHPVTVRFLYLKDTHIFATSSFEELWSDPVGQLGADLLEGYKEVILAPGTEKTVELTRPEGARTVAMLVNFCAEGDINSRRYLFPLHSKGLEKTVNLQGVNFSVK
jgi:type VI secretion system VasD/TssJ family lipoprotein